MPSTFLTLQIGVSALEATQMGVDTTGHNIANANTAGYARETTDLETANSLEVFTDHQAFLGQGVNGRGQLRVDDTAVDGQYRNNNTQQSYWQTKNTELGVVGQAFNEPSGTTLRSSIDNFFSAWNQLAQPGYAADQAARASVYEAGQQLVDSFHSLSNTLKDDQARYVANMDTSIQQVNSIATSISQLNTQILQKEANGGTPNDLLDQRDALLDNLSNYVPVKVTYTPDATNPSVTHMSIDLPLASGSTVNLVTDGTFNSSALPQFASPSSPTNAELANIAQLAGGQGSLKAAYDMYEYIGDPSTPASGVMAQLNSLASSIISGVNNLPGVDLNANTGTVMFDPSAGATTAATIAINPTFGNPPDYTKIGAASSSVTTTDSTDGSNAAAIAALLQPQPANPNSGFDQQYAAIITQVGTDGQAANQENQTYSALTTQSTQLRQSISGVNLNEEMSNMVQFQQSYSAAAKLVSVFNDMLTTLISNV